MASSPRIRLVEHLRRSLGLILVSGVDNLIRPYFLGRANSLPVLLGLFGLVGGVLAFGFIGLFIGPTMLAVAYTSFSNGPVRNWRNAEAPRLHRATNEVSGPRSSALE
jgi:predicted PurR-regulated permease PerM